MKAPNTPFELALFRIGGQSGLADLLSEAWGVRVSRQVVNGWINSRGFPVRKCPQIVTATHGLLNRQLTRPADWHLFWPELADGIKPARRHPARQNVGGVGKSVGVV